MNQFIQNRFLPYNYSIDFQNGTMNSGRNFLIKITFTCFLTSDVTDLVPSNGTLLSRTTAEVTETFVGVSLISSSLLLADEVSKLFCTTITLVPHMRLKTKTSLYSQAITYLYVKTHPAAQNQQDFIGSAVRAA